MEQGMVSLVSSGATLSPPPKMITLREEKNWFSLARGVRGYRPCSHHLLLLNKGGSEAPLPLGSAQEIPSLRQQKPFPSPAPLLGRAAMLFPALGQPSLAPACPFSGLLWGLPVGGTLTGLSCSSARLFIYVLVYFGVAMLRLKRVPHPGAPAWHQGGSRGSRAWGEEQPPH